MAKAHVLTLEQMRAMASPVRQRIIAALYARGDSSVTEIAETLERKPDTLYHHLRVLLSVGLLQKTGERIAGKNREAIYAPIETRLRADHESTNPVYLAEFARMIRINLKDAATNHAKAFSDASSRGKTLFETANVRLTAKQVRELNAELRRFFEKVKAESSREGERHYYVFLSTPTGT